MSTTFLEENSVCFPQQFFLFPWARSMLLERGSLREVRDSFSFIETFSGKQKSCGTEDGNRKFEECE